MHTIEIKVVEMFNRKIQHVYINITVDYKKNIITMHQY